MLNFDAIMFCSELRRLFDSRGKEIALKKGVMKVIITDMDIEWPEKVNLEVEDIKIAGVPTPVFVLSPII